MTVVKPRYSRPGAHPHFSGFNCSCGHSISRTWILPAKYLSLVNEEALVTTDHRLGCVCGMYGNSII